ncbi:DDE-type integrase/transposase/recombinase [Azospirillum soli]|uniref:DDE-type integrase/transposase/recombinase n=1 Tax=Azospirillum soli TaxID=1304799 RepID=UPI001AEADC55
MIPPPPSGSFKEPWPDRTQSIPRTITVDKNAAYPQAVAHMTWGRRLWRFARLRRVKYLNIVEQDHRRIKRLVRPRLGFKNF